MKLRTIWMAPLAALAVACSGAGDGGNGNGNGNGADAAAAGPAKADVSVTAVDFGGVDCGGDASGAKNVVVTNAGGSTLTWSAALDHADAFALSGAANGTLAAGESATLVVTAKAVPSTTKAGDVAQASLAVTTSDPAKAMTAVALSRTAQGASFELMPITADFGDLPVHHQAPDVALTVRNTGNKAADVRLVASGGDFDATWAGAPAAATLAPETELKGAAARFKPGSNKPQSGKIALDVKGAVCGVRGDIPVKGTGTNGVAGVSPGTLNYGLVDCGTQAVAQQLSVLNTGNAPFDFTATLAKGQSSSYQLSQTSGTVLAGNQVQILVTPKAIPQTSATTKNLYGDTLTISTTAADDQPHTVDLEQTAHGAILAFGAGAIPFGAQQVGSSPTKPLQIENDGNLTAPIAISLGGPFSTSSSVNLGGGASTNLTLAYAPDPKQLGQVQASSLSISTSATLCGALPGAVGVTGSSFDRGTQLSAGDSSTCVLATSGNVYCWGDDSYGQLGDGTAGGSRARPYPVQGLSGNLTQLATAGVSSCTLTSSNTVQCWGANYYGQLGNGTMTDSPSPVWVSNVSDATKLAAGRSWVCGVRKGGGVTCWGSNYDGQLGNGTTNASSVPVNVSGLVDAVDLGGGYSHACAIRQGGSMTCWGSNYYGELGNGTTTSSTVPAAVSSLSAATATAFGLGNHSCAVRQGGSVACWGDDYSGQLGNGTTTNATTFVSVSNLVDAKALALGASHTCAVRSGGGVVCWGDDAYGELGNNGTTSSPVPVAVSNLSGVSAVTAGGSHTCALRTNGTVACWGYNYYGQLGNGGTTTSLVPVDVVGLD